eukprot:m51a1_g6046 hypothetical protein (71) ;mRNA; f:197425-197637
MSAIGSPVSYSETTGVTLGGLAQGGIRSQRNPENSNRRYITIPPEASTGISALVDWWANYEYLSFIPVHP